MKSSSDQRQQFATTLVVAGIIALVLAATLVLFMYGCMKTTSSPPVKQTTVFSIEKSDSSILIFG